MQNDLTTGSVFRNVMSFSLPYLLSYFLQTLYGVPVAVTQVQAGSRVFSVCTPYVTDD